MLGSLGLYERTEVRDALAYLTLLQNPRDAQALRRAIASPRRGVGTATIARLIAWAREHHGADLIAASRNAGDLDRVPSEAARARLVEFGMALVQVRSELDAGRSLGHIVIATVTVPGGLVRHYEHVRDHSPNHERRADAERVLEDLRSLCRAAQAYEEQHEDATLTGFLDHAAGLHAREVDAATDHRITVSTIHRAKGAEAELVVLLACEEQLLPSWRSLASPDPGRLEEERRLFYVAATRAKDRLLITHAAERGRRPTGGPSRFLREAGLLGARRVARRLNGGDTSRPVRSAPSRRARPSVPSFNAITGESDARQQYGAPRAVRPHSRRGRGAVPPAVRAGGDRLPGDDQGALQRRSIWRRPGRCLPRRAVRAAATQCRGAGALAPGVPAARPAARAPSGCT